MISLKIDGVPGPKGSVNAFCVRCAQRRLKQNVVIKEQSEAGVTFRKALALHLAAERPAAPHAGPVSVTAWIYIPRRHAVRAGIEQEAWVPSHAGPYPIDRNSGDIEKHIRTLHDAAQDARVLADDSTVVDLHAYKRWADERNTPGMLIFLKAL